MAFVGNVQLIAGVPESIPEVLGELSAAEYETGSNPDLYVRTYPSFGIDEARELRDRAFARAVSGRRIYVLAMPSMTTEAQNALLKTLEEPPGDALFVFILPSPETLLATLRSRAHIHTIHPAAVQGGAARESLDARAFMAASPAARIDMLKPLLERGDADGRDIGAVIAFLASLERLLAERPAGDVRAGLDAVYRARRFASDKGALLKPLLEQVALLAPVL